MKKIIIPFLLLCIVCTNCKKNNINEGDYIEDVSKKYTGTASCTINGVSKTYYPQCSWLSNRINGDTLNFGFFKYNQFGENRENIYINLIPNNFNKHRIYKNTLGPLAYSLYSTREADGDAISGIYYLLESDTVNNYFQITNYNANTLAIGGTFGAVYTRTVGVLSPTTPDTIRITNGVFNTIVNYKQ